MFADKGFAAKSNPEKRFVKIPQHTIMIADVISNTKEDFIINVIMHQEVKLPTKIAIKPAPPPITIERNAKIRSTSDLDAPKVFNMHAS